MSLALAELTVVSMNVLLVSTYEMGRQPFGLASPAAVLQDAGHEVTCLDLSVQRLDIAAVERAELIAVYLPMHTATRIALALIDQVRSLNPTAHLCAYGLYAPLCSDLLRRRGVETIVGGEFEPGLRRLAARLAADCARPRWRRTGGDAAVPSGSPMETAEEAVDQMEGPEPAISLERQDFLLPRRAGLPPLSAYAHLIATDGSRRTVGYTESSRGCKHVCRHCPVVPIYGGRFRIVQLDVVLADIDQQVEMGAEHITFGDPDFFNGPTHAIEIVRRLHQRHPRLTYDATIKIEHLLRHADLLPRLSDTGCAFVTSAVESVDDTVLQKLAKGHTTADFERVVEVFREIGLALQPTFVAFTPWMTLEGYEHLLATIARLDLVDCVAPIQLAIRLLIPAGSRLLELEEIRRIAPELDPKILGHPWQHDHPRVDALQREVERLVARAGEEADRRAVFRRAWGLVQSALERPNPLPLPAAPTLPGRPRATIPYLSEPWYC